MNGSLGCWSAGAETEAKSALAEAPPPVSLTLNAVERYCFTFYVKMVSPVCGLLFVDRQQPGFALNMRVTAHSSEYMCGV